MPARAVVSICVGTLGTYGSARRIQPIPERCIQSSHRMESIFIHPGHPILPRLVLGPRIPAKILWSTVLHTVNHYNKNHHHQRQKERITRNIIKHGWQLVLARQHQVNNINSNSTSRSTWRAQTYVSCVAASGWSFHFLSRFRFRVDICCHFSYVTARP